jgi:hypothetical protein
VRKIKFLLIAIVGAALAVSAQAQSIHLPDHSTWKLNAADTDFGGGPPLKSDIFTVYKDSDALLKFRETTVDAAGKVEHTSFSAPEDGTMHPVSGVAGQQMSFTPDGKLQITFPDGSTQDLQESLSADGKKVTYEGTMKTKDGKTFNQKWVYDRIK